MVDIQIPSLFQDNTVSWVSIVNGVDKYVTESMLTTKEEDIASGKPIAKAGPRQKPTITLTSVSIGVLERKWIDIETQRSHDHKSKAITRLLRNDQSIEESTERSTTVTSWKSAGRRSSTILHNGYLKIGYQNWQKGEERRKDFNIAWIQTLPINSCPFEQFKDIDEKVRRKKSQERKKSSILHCSEPDGRRIWHGGNSIRSFETKDRAIQEYLETTSK